MNADMYTLYLFKTEKQMGLLEIFDTWYTKVLLEGKEPDKKASDAIQG